MSPYRINPNPIIPESKLRYQVRCDTCCKVRHYYPYRITYWRFLSVAKLHAWIFLFIFPYGYADIRAVPIT